MLRYFFYIISLFFGFSLLFSGIIIYLAFFSPNKGNMVHTYFPQVHAKINFFQDAPVGINSQYPYSDYPYIPSNKGTWTSPQWLNQSFNKTRVTLAGEVVSPPVGVTTVTVIISRDSH